MSTMNDENARFALAMRMGRAALGINQQEMADLLGVAKSTIARNETLEMVIRAETLFTLIRILKERGVMLDLISQPDAIHVEVSNEAVQQLKLKMEDESQRRIDRKSR